MKELSQGHGDPAGDVFQNIGGILDEPANDVRPVEIRETAAGEGVSKH
jgi:hypothetical protein